MERIKKGTKRKEGGTRTWKRNEVELQLNEEYNIEQKIIFNMYLINYTLYLYKVIRCFNPLILLTPLIALTPLTSLTSLTNPMNPLT